MEKIIARGKLVGSEGAENLCPSLLLVNYVLESALCL